MFKQATGDEDGLLHSVHFYSFPIHIYILYYIQFFLDEQAITPTWT